MSMSYTQAVAELESFGVMPERPPSLEPMKRAFAALVLEQRIPPEKVIVVAGTNGKGSTSAMLSALLSEAGSRTGLYTSPHLIQTTERIRVGERDLSPEAFVIAYLAIRSVALALKLTHFEALTAMAAWVFFSGEAGTSVDFAVFEVGLGGVWDATNAVPHNHCIVTRLGLDHQNLLGSELSGIARNKFGIVTQGSTVVHAPLPPEALAPMNEARARTFSRWIQAPEVRLEVVRENNHLGDGPRFYAHTPWGRAELALPGARGAENASLALKAFETLGFDPAPHLGALKQVRWPGRMERIQIAGARCPVFLSGDHNPQGMASLLELLPAYLRRELHCLAGVGKDKDLDGILEPLSRIPRMRLYLTQLPFRPRLLQDYGKWLSVAQYAHANPVQVLARILEQAEPDDLVLVTGSLYLVGAIRALAY